MLGSPYGTSIWQTGDTRSKNSQYKNYTYLRKNKVLAQKRRLFNFHSRVNLSKTGIIPIINVSFSKSFEVTSLNITTISTRGWSPLSYNLLNNIKLQPDINNLQTTSTNNSNPPPSPRNNNTHL